MLVPSASVILALQPVFNLDLIQVRAFGHDCLLVFEQFKAANWFHRATVSVTGPQMFALLNAIKDTVGRRPNWLNLDHMATRRQDRRDNSSRSLVLLEDIWLLEDINQCLWVRLRRIVAL